MYCFQHAKCSQRQILIPPAKADGSFVHASLIHSPTTTHCCFLLSICSHHVLACTYCIIPSCADSLAGLGDSSGILCHHVLSCSILPRWPPPTPVRLPQLHLSALVPSVFLESVCHVTYRYPAAPLAQHPRLCCNSFPRVSVQLSLHGLLLSDCPDPVSHVRPMGLLFLHMLYPTQLLIRVLQASAAK